MKNMLNKFLIIIIIFLGILMVHTQIYAFSNAINDGKNFVSQGKTNGTGLNGDAIKNASSSIYNILLGVGIIIAMAVSVFLGAKFIISSAEEKADIKSSMLPFIIGTTVMFGAFGIWRILLNMLSALE